MKSDIVTHQLITLKPKPSRATIDNLVGCYYDHQASSYDELDCTTLRRIQSHATIERLITERLKVEEMRSHALSVGCGTGRREENLARTMLGTIEFDAIETSAKMKQLAVGRGLSLIDGSIQDAKLQESYYDFVVYLYSFPALATRQCRISALRTICRALRPGGILFLDVASIDDIHDWGAKVKDLHKRESLETCGYDPGDFFFGRLGDDTPTFWHFFSENELRELLTDAGFSVESITYVGFMGRAGEITNSSEGMMLSISRKL